MKKSTVVYSLVIMITILFGLASRKLPHLFHPFLVTYLGDTLWALLVFWLLRIFLIKKSVVTIAIAAFSFSLLIETSQLYQAPWINSVRASTLGALVLGHGFLWSDLVCYAAGCVAGMVIEYLLIKNMVNSCAS